MKHMNGPSQVDDRLVTRWFRDGKVISQGKRVRAGCPVSDRVRKLYVKGNVIHAVKQIRGERGCSLKAAKARFDFARYGDW